MLNYQRVCSCDDTYPPDRKHHGDHSDHRRQAVCVPENYWYETLRVPGFSFYILLFNIIQQSSRYSQSEAGWWCLKHLCFRFNWAFRFNWTMISGTQESCSNLFDEIIQPEDTQFLVMKEGAKKGAKKVHLGPPVGFQDSKLLFFWIMCRHTPFATFKRFKKCLAGSLIEAERLENTH